jgi:hypothetical protein
MALAGLLLTLLLYFTGFHSEAEKLGTAQTISTVGGLAIGITFITLGIKARRAEVPATEAFGYGRALGAGVMIGVFGSLFGIVTNFLYMHVINPGLTDLMVQAQIAKWETLGMSSERIEQAEKMMRTMMNPALQAVFGIVIGVLFCTIISLIVAAFLKREATEVQPPVAA